MTVCAYNVALSDFSDNSLLCVASHKHVTNGLVLDSTYMVKL